MFTNLHTMLLNLKQQYWGGLIELNFTTRFSFLESNTVTARTEKEIFARKHIMSSHTRLCSQTSQVSEKQQGGDLQLSFLAKEKRTRISMLQRCKNMRC